MHVVVVVVALAPFAHADDLTRPVQPHDLARLAVHLHVVDLDFSIGRRCPPDTLAHGFVHRLDRQDIRQLLHVCALELS